MWVWFITKHFDHLFVPLFLEFCCELVLLFWNVRDPVLLEAVWCPCRVTTGSWPTTPATPSALTKHYSALSPPFGERPLPLDHMCQTQGPRARSGPPSDSIRPAGSSECCKKFHWFEWATVSFYLARQIKCKVYQSWPTVLVLLLMFILFWNLISVFIGNN